ncbi:hypothetical protein SAMN02745119_02146 [Trichlorobacter thiogenes]|uniref:Uncharacterized protein n=1 Tax=Trichlorobacter thiogenes TaxID=115783 RepID=A0A1T4PXX8_9BACT|nr:hypothetical protein [Trichlorobacter thiogenes]SJZ96343.1 hypothetical protein SAMN02745119_02146 [Trichlorobacter thiogenes]
MNPATLIPIADTLTAPNGWFQFFLMLTFPLHLFAMNAMLGAGLVAFISHLYPGRAYRELSHELAKALPFLVAFTVNLGVAPLLFVNVIYGHLLYSSTVLMGLYWLAVIPLLIIAYYLAYIYDFSFKQLGNLAMFVLLAVLVLLLTVGFIFSNNMSMMISPVSWSRWFTTPGGTLLNLADPTLLPRYLHIITGSLAVGGLFSALYASTLLKSDPEVSEAGKKLGMQLFSWLTLLQFGVGTWFLLTLPQKTMSRFMGGSPVATLLLVVGVLLAVATLITGFKRLVLPTVCLTLPLVYVMSFMRDVVRGNFLAPYFNPSTVPVQVQWSPLIFFLVTLMLGLVLVVWMLSKLQIFKKVS